MQFSHIIHQIQGSVQPHTSLDVSGRRKISYNWQGSNPGMSMPQPCHYTAYTTWLLKGRNTLFVSLIQDHDRYVTEMFKKFPVVNNLVGSGLYWILF
jgi:hypothetical protein